jgi:hypothetical protein
MTPQAVKEISEFFKDYKSVPSVARVWKHIKDVQTKLRTQLDQDFDALYVSVTVNHKSN